MQRAFFALILIICGWLAPALAIGPNYIDEPGAVVEAEIDDQRPVVLAFLALRSPSRRPAAISSSIASEGEAEGRFKRFKLTQPDTR